MASMATDSDLLTAALTEKRGPATDPGDLNEALDGILTKARRFTRAEAGTIYVRDGDLLRFASMQNDVLARQGGEKELRRRLGADPLRLSPHSLAGYVSLTGRALNIQDAYRIPSARPYRFDRALDALNGYRTVSVFLVPIHDQSKAVLGVIQLINALDSRGRPVPFQPPFSYVQRTLASDAGAAIRRAAGRAPGASTSAFEPGQRLAENGLAALQETVPAAASGGLRGATDPEARSPIGRQLSELLIAAGLITPEILDQALAEQSRTRHKLGAILVRMGALAEDTLITFLARQYGIPTLAVPESVDPELLSLVPAAIAQRHELIPVERTDRSLVVAMSDPTNLAAIDDLAFRTGYRVVVGIAAASVIRRAVEQWYRIPAEKLDEVLSDSEGTPPELEIMDTEDDEPPSDLVELRASSDQEPVVRLVNMLLLDAIRRGASDIHLEPFQNVFRVRFRIDGVLHQVTTPSQRFQGAIISRIKIMADLDISERRRAQDGHIRLRSGDREVDVRVATLPTVFGESIVLRILDRDASALSLGRLGLDEATLEHFHAALHAPHGLILVTGPTGSGKTTTLYAALQSLNTLQAKIVTIEDPVEYRLEGVTQVQVHEETGRTFATALRAFLRSDPNVIMVGEMRDSDTIQAATRAALTGHLVLSTLHTNDGASTVVRLLDMGVPAFLIAASLRLVIAQRLVRTVCAECREGYEASEGSLAPYGHRPTGQGPFTLFRGRGCPRCDFTGMKGRIGLHEVMPVTPALRELIARGPSTDEVRALAQAEGMLLLRRAGLRKAIEGVTSVDEVLRVTSDLS
jgi:type IV pilus assembly protein PilB